ncbi:SPINT3 [Bugula neritina]|uniref:SPINT3 n=1 Tax=Bugula neritina TaxID=10212 RepID=A0A7J7ITX9_BUGNE|nr:SPINT3 [Bugula neritina]
MKAIIATLLISAICLVQLTQAGPPDVCDLPLVTGPCRAYFPRYGFSGGRCIRFVYGGCQGNGNNFITKSACEAACK